MKKKVDELYSLSIFRWFIRTGAPLFILLVIIIVLIFCIFPFLSDSDVMYTAEELLKLFIGLIVCAALLSYAYPLIGIVKLKKQELIIHKCYKDRMRNGLKQAKKEWFVCSSRARLIVYHRDYIESIVNETKEDRHNESASVTVYLTYIKNCKGNQEKITFLSRNDATDFRRWFNS